MSDRIHDNVATKDDLQRVESALRNDINRADAALRSDFNRVEFSLRAEINRLSDRLMIRGIGALVTGLGALFAALHYWPPHQ